jgi:hypothetical protein
MSAELERHFIVNRFPSLRMLPVAERAIELAVEAQLGRPELWDAEIDLPEGVVSGDRITIEVWEAVSLFLLEAFVRQRLPNGSRTQSMLD